MNATRVWLLALFITISAPSAGFGDKVDQLVASYGIGGNASTTVNEGMAPPVQTFNQSDQQKVFIPVNGHQQAVSGGNSDAVSQQAEASATASAMAQPGSLHVSFSGIYAADTIGPVNSFGAPAASGAAGFFGGATARFSEDVTFTSGELPVGAQMHLTGNLFFDGDLSVLGDGNGDAFVRVQDSDIQPGIGDFEVDTSGGPIANHIFTNLPTSFTVENGISHFVDVSISVGGALSDGSGSDPGSSVGGMAIANFSNTLRWGGITSALSDTGEPIDDLVATSVSGFDYTKPAPLPEPTSLTLAGLATLGAIFFRGIRGPRGAGRAVVRATPAPVKIPRPACD
jgi:hypothetical protein